MHYLYVYNQLINLYFIERDQSAKCKYGGCMSRRSTVSSAGEQRCGCNESRPGCGETQIFSQTTVTRITNKTRNNVYRYSWRSY